MRTKQSALLLLALLLGPSSLTKGSVPAAKPGPPRAGVPAGITVVVVDREGHPVAGVAVGVRALRQGHPLGAFGSLMGSKLTYSGRSDASGLVKLDSEKIFPRDYYIGMANRPVPYDRSQFWVGLNFPGAPAPKRVAGPYFAPAQLKLVLAPTARLEVALRDAQGHPLKGMATVSAWDARAPGFVSKLLAKEGAVVFPRVGVSAPILVQVRAMDGLHRPGAIVTVPPPKPGECAHAQAAAGELYPVLEGRLFRNDGSAAAQTSFAASLHPRRQRRPYYFTTSASGDFRIVLRYPVSTKRPLSLDIWEGKPVIGIQRDAPIEAMATIQLPEKLAAGPISLGNLLLLPLGR